MKRPQWITLAAALILVVILYKFGRITPEKKHVSTQNAEISDSAINTNSILSEAKKRLSAAQIARLGAIEHSVVRGAIRDQQLKVYHQLAHFWLDSAQFFEPYAFYEAESARLENSEKSLTYRAIARFESVYRLSKENIDTQLEACLMLAEAYERKADKSLAVGWYEKSLALIKNEEVKEEVRKRIVELRK